MESTTLMTQIRSGLLAGALCCLVACSGGSGDGDGNDNPGGNNGGSTSAGSFLNDVKAAICNNAKRCSPGFEYLICQGSLLNDPSQGEDPNTAVQAGRATFDSAKAKACLEAINTAACSGGVFGNIDNAACDGVLKGAVAAGGTCYLDEECADGFCAFGDACPGKCQTYAKSGEACSDTVRCGPALYCDADAAKCAARKANGTACGTGDECTSGNCDQTGDSPKCAPVGGSGTGTAGASCQVASDCADGFFCKSGTGGGGKCTANIAKGQKCGENGDMSAIQAGCGRLACAGASVSLSGTAPSMVAGTCADWSNVGGPCTRPPEGAMFAVSGCMYGLACGSDGKCALPPTTGPCSAEPTARCAESAWCDDGDNTCKPKKAAGAECRTSDECATGTCEDGGTCAAAAPVCKP